MDVEEPTHKTQILTVDPKILAASYKYCRLLTQTHYENFPVASRLLPKAMRPAVEAVYAFSRTADDFADERDYREVRLDRLNQWREFLNEQGTPTHPIFIALHDTIAKHELPKRLLDDLITAFIMDVHKNRYDSFDEVLHYCKHSANPVGRIVLHLFKQDTAENLQHSDAICTALQLANFWQDVGVDLQKDRIYIPTIDLERYNLTEQDLFQMRSIESFKRLMVYEVERTWELFQQGKPLGLNLPGKLGVEIRLTWLGGVSILKKIREQGYNTLQQRPKLTRMEFAKLLWVALSKNRYRKFGF